MKTIIFEFEYSEMFQSIEIKLFWKDMPDKKIHGVLSLDKTLHLQFGNIHNKVMNNFRQLDVNLLNCIPLKNHVSNNTTFNVEYHAIGFETMYRLFQIFGEKTI